jgi:hypothetical protein
MHSIYLFYGDSFYAFLKIINCLNIIHRPNLIENGVSETEIFLRPQVKYTQLGPTDIDNPCRLGPTE